MSEVFLRLGQAFFLSILKKTQRKKTPSFLKTQPFFAKNSPKFCQKLNASELFIKYYLWSTNKMPYPEYPGSWHWHMLWDIVKVKSVLNSSIYGLITPFYDKSGSDPYLMVPCNVSYPISNFFCAHSLILVPICKKWVAAGPWSAAIVCQRVYFW